MNLEIFKHGIKFNSWGEIYAGIKGRLISRKTAFELIQSENILFDCNDDRLIKLYLADEGTTEEFFDTINSFIIKDDSISIEYYVDDTGFPYGPVPEQYLDIWKLELLLRVERKDLPIEEKMWEVYYRVCGRFRYPQDLSNFAVYGGAKVLSMEKLYDRMKTYIKRQIKYFHKSNKEIIKKRRG